MSKNFRHYALATYVAGLGAYLGFMWQNNLDVDAGHIGSRNIFIVFLICTGLCACVYGLSHFTQHESRRWRSYLEVFEAVECEAGNSPVTRKEK